MAPPKEEWLLHAYELESQLKILTQRINDNTARGTEHIPLLIERVKDLAASNDHLQEENNAMKDRIRLLEQEANQQDQLNARKSQEQQKLETKNEVLRSEFNNVLSAMERMEKNMGAERKQNKQEMLALREQVEKLMAGSGPSFNHRAFAAGPRTSRYRAVSQATTADGGMHIDQDISNLPSTPVQRMGSMAMQGNLTLEEYLAYGESLITGWETQAVKDFVNGMNEFTRRKVIWEKLEKVGWTWGHLRPEVQRMIEGMRRRSKRRRLAAPEEA